MTQPSSQPPSRRERRDDIPPGIDPLGVPRATSGRDAFVLTAAVVVALLALIFTLGWIVFHQLTTGGR